MDVDRSKDRAATVGRRGSTATQQGLVDVVVENCPKPSAIFAAQSPRQGLGEGIANCIWMTQTLSLDDLYQVVKELERRYDERAHSMPPPV
jgi:hypothetical protein